MTFKNNNITMKLMSFKFFLLFLVVAFLSSCLGTTEDTTPISSDATFYSLTLAKNDSVKSAVFTLDGKTIVNVDSLPFGTKVDSVYPSFRFNSTAIAILYIDKGTKTDSILLTGKDTVDFSNIVTLKNYATDLVSYETYSIKVNVHKVEPKLYNWNKYSNSIESRGAKNQKAVVLKDSLFYFLNNGTNAYLYKSTNGKDWTELTLTGFPVDNSISDMLFFKDNFYLTQNSDKIYSSSTRRNWTTLVNANYNFKTLLYVLNDNLWAIVESKADLKYRFASSTNGIDWNIRGEIPANFPVRDFAAISFTTRTGLQKVLVVGGYSVSNTTLTSRWSSEDGAYWVDFSNSNRSLDTLSAGASIVSYDNQLFVFGIRNDKNETHFKQSIDEGFSWQTPDTIYNNLKDNANSYQVRNYQSVVVMNPKKYAATNSASLLNEIIKSNQLFIIGGKTNTEVLSDVWRGKLNQKNFLRQ